MEKKIWLGLSSVLGLVALIQWINIVVACGFTNPLSCSYYKILSDLLISLLSIRRLTLLILVISYNTSILFC